jgi:hypothetical protein
MEPKFARQNTFFPVDPFTPVSETLQKTPQIQSKSLSAKSNAAYKEPAERPGCQAVA